MNREKEYSDVLDLMYSEVFNKNLVHLSEWLQEANDGLEPQASLYKELLIRHATTVSDFDACAQLLAERSNVLAKLLFSPVAEG